MKFQDYPLICRTNPTNMTEPDIIQLAKHLSRNKLDKLRTDLDRIYIECIYNEIMSVVPDEIWKKIMMTFFSDTDFELFKNGNRDFFELQVVCKKWTKAIFSFETLHIDKHVSPLFWKKCVGLKNLKVSSNCMITFSNNDLMYLEKLDLVNINFKCTIDFSFIANLTELSLSYHTTTPENIQYLKKLKVLVTLSCPAISAIIDAALPMLEKIVLEKPASDMDVRILDSSPKLKMVGIFNLDDQFVAQYASCLTFMKHRIELETSREELLQHGIAGTYILRRCNIYDQIVIRKSQNWHEMKMNGMSSSKTYAISERNVGSSYYRYISTCNKDAIESECLGHCIDNQLHGYGTLHKNGNVYTGSWEKNEPIGDFIVKFGNGYHYHGNIDKSYQISGSGTLTRSDGCVIVSDKWRDGTIEAKCLTLRFHSTMTKQKISSCYSHFQTNMAENSYHTTAHSLLETAKLYLYQPNWNFVLEKSGTLLESRDFPDTCSIPCYRVSTTIKKQKDDLCSRIWDISQQSARIDDPDITSLTIIETGPNHKIRRQTNHMPWPLWPRETVSVQVRIDEGDTTWFVGYSIDHPDVVQTDAYVRTNVHMSVYEITMLDPNSTRVRRVVQLDPCGDIPTFLVTSQTGKMVDAINRWKNV